MSGRRRVSGPSPRDLELFHRVVADVRPLRAEPPLVAPKNPARPGADEKKPHKVKPTPSKAKPSEANGLARSPAAVANHVPGRVPGIDRRTALRLKRGKTEIDGRIDLHGMTQERARAALLGFVTSGHKHGRRTLLVITGKGRRNGPDNEGFAGPETGVLRRMVPRWLSEPPLAGCVVAYSPAQPEHGGAGALYVLLKRRRAS